MGRFSGGGGLGRIHAMLHVMPDAQHALLLPHGQLSAVSGRAPTVLLQSRGLSQAVASCP